MRRIFLELGPQRSNVVVDGAGAGIVFITPDLVEKILAGDHLTRLSCQQAQDTELLTGHPEGFAPFFGLHSAGNPLPHHQNTVLGEATRQVEPDGE